MKRLFGFLGAMTMSLSASQTVEAPSACGMSWFSSWCEKWQAMPSMHKMIILGVVAALLLYVLMRLLRGFGGCCSTGCHCGDKCNCKK